MSHGLVQKLFAGPIDIVGDIHGEIHALRDLFKQLGYDGGGVHPQGRRLVFIGDLTDRGPDSPAVVDLVSGLVSRGLAQCVLGNHELNLLREARKEGNGWFHDENQDHLKNKFLESRPLEPMKRPAVRKFLSGLPIAMSAQRGFRATPVRGSALSHQDRPPGLPDGEHNDGNDIYRCGPGLED